MGTPQRVKVDSDMIDYVEHWEKGVGSGSATRHLLSYINKTPELRAAMNNNPYLAQNALNRLERDQQWASKWGAPREDIQNARRIISEGRGWIDKFEAALAMPKGTPGAILPAIGAAILGPALLRFSDEGS